MSDFIDKLHYQQTLAANIGSKHWQEALADSADNQ